ncbi:MAG: hypothetical protein KDI50_01695 [Candidatus Competibacteraceae bacterium]|nr:hypothetical protein [Candidatus Competibacteraceae bacterium]
MARSLRCQTTTALSSPVLPWLLVWVLGLELILGPRFHQAFSPIAPAAAQSRIEEFKGALGKGVRSDDIPAGRTGWTFGLGAGADTDRLRPPTYSQKFSLDANFSAGFGYSCGQFNAFDNVEAMINQTIEKFKELPQMFVMAVQGAIAALPAYILNKINPTLYNTVTKNLDEAFRLFEVNFKDCQTIEREIALGQNPYQSLVMAGIGDRMRVEMGFGNGTIDERMKVVRTNGPSNGVVMSAGKRYGGDGQEPIDATKDVLTSGVNLLTDRDVSNTDVFGASLHALHPVTTVFKSPDDLVAFITDIYGSRSYLLTKEGPTETKPGYGYQKKYIEMRDDTIEALQKYVSREIDRKTFEQETELLIPPETINEMRGLPSYSLSIAIDDQARTHAVERLKRKLDYALQSLKTGLTEPNLAQSEAYEVIERETTKLIIAIQDDLAHIESAVYLR